MFDTITLAFKYDANFLGAQPIPFALWRLRNRLVFLFACIVMEFCAANSRFDCLLLDLDDTLYSPTIGLGQACRKNIEDFLATKCAVSGEEANSLRAELFQSHGSSLAGLIARGFEVHPDEYHSFVHGRLPYELIKPDPQLQELLLSIPHHKILFTNSDRQHAERVLQRLGIGEGCFQSIICFETMNPHLFNNGTAAESREVILKPSAAAMEMALQIAGFAPHRTLYADDSERNIAAGKAVGLATALVGKSVEMKEADYLLDNIHELKQVVIEESCGEHDLSTLMRSEIESIRPTSSIGAWSSCLHRRETTNSNAVHQ